MLTHPHPRPRSPRQMIFCCDSQAERDSWVELLQRAMTAKADEQSQRLGANPLAPIVTRLLIAAAAHLGRMRRQETERYSKIEQLLSAITAPPGSEEFVRRAFQTYVQVW